MRLQSQSWHIRKKKTNLRSKDIKGTETCGKRPATMNQTHQVIGTCAAHISWNLRSRDSEVEFKMIEDPWAHKNVSHGICTNT